MSITCTLVFPSQNDLFVSDGLVPCIGVTGFDWIHGPSRREQIIRPYRYREDDGPDAYFEPLCVVRVHVRDSVPDTTAHHVDDSTLSGPTRRARSVRHEQVRVVYGSEGIHKSSRPPNVTGRGAPPFYR